MMSNKSTAEIQIERHLAEARSATGHFLAEPTVLAFAQEGKAPTVIQIFPAGPDIATVDGRKFKLSDPDGFAERFNAAAQPILVDYDHLSHFMPDEGGSSKAAGWIQKLEVRNGEIWGVVEWTVTAAQEIANKEYRFISPEFVASSKTGELLGLDAVALVNRPAFQMTALTNVRKKSNSTGDEPMKSIALKLGLKEDATEAEILAAIEKQETELAAANTELASTKSKIKTPSTDDFMPRADYDAVLARATKAEEKLTEQEDKQFKTKVTAAIEQAVTDGKITPGTKDHYIALASDEASLEKVLTAIGAAPKVVGKTDISGKPEDGKSVLTSEQKDMAATLGVSEEDYAKQLDAEKAA